MRSRLCSLKTVKPLKMILDSAMASKMKNIYHKKNSLFYPEDGFHPKKLHGLSEEPNPLEGPSTAVSWLWRMLPSFAFWAYDSVVWLLLACHPHEPSLTILILAPLEFLHLLSSLRLLSPMCLFCIFCLWSSLSPMCFLTPLVHRAPCPLLTCALPAGEWSRE